MTENIFAPSKQTAEISTGDVATVNDLFDSTKPNNKARNPLGAAYYGTDSSGRPLKFRYVRVNSTVPPTEVVGPVWWKDNTFTVVTAVRSEAVHDTANAVAGILINEDIGNGNFGFIQVAGFLAAMPIVAATAVGDAIIGGATGQLTARVAANTAPSNRLIAWALTAVSGGVSDVEIVLEN